MKRKACLIMAAIAFFAVLISLLITHIRDTHTRASIDKIQIVFQQQHLSGEVFQFAEESKETADQNLIDAIWKEYRSLRPGKTGRPIGRPRYYIIFMSGTNTVDTWGVNYENVMFGERFGAGHYIKSKSRVYETITDYWEQIEAKDEGI